MKTITIKSDKDCLLEEKERIQNIAKYFFRQESWKEMTVEQAIVKKVLILKVFLVVGRIPANIRKILNDSVKKKKLAHMKKDGHKPEVFYNPRFGYLAEAERNQHELDILNVLSINEDIKKKKQEMLFFY